MSGFKTLGILILLLVGGAGVFVVKRPLPAHAQSGCDLRINEIMYDPAAGIGVDARAEWVELYVVSPITVDTTFFVTDQDAPAAGVFNKQFVVPAGTAVGTYIVVHNDGNPADDGITGTTGIYTTISFYMGNNAVKLNNNGDEIVLYQGGDVDGTPCDYVEYLVPNSPLPAGFTWNNGSCTNPSSAQDFGTSISLDPDGVNSNDACDWTESGLNSPNDPGIPVTGSPDTMGYNNTTTPTAVSLMSFSASTPQTGTAIFSIAVTIMAALTGWGLRIKNR